MQRTIERVSVGLPARWIDRIYCVAAVIWLASRGIASAMVIMYLCMIGMLYFVNVV